MTYEQIDKLSEAIRAVAKSMAADAIERSFGTCGDTDSIVQEVSEIASAMREIGAALRDIAEVIRYK